MQADREYQELLLGRLAPPHSSEQININLPTSRLTDEQKSILSEMISAEKYYLLWGPPGTGKTSAMLRYYMEHIFKETEEIMLVLAYTNRAVDEICEAISNIGSDIDNYFIRIGSRYSTSPGFRDNLLVSKLDQINNRKELKSLFTKTRIVVSTLASIHGKKEIFSLINFDTILVDEASQILEPQIIGLLSKAPKFILIGDHNQLPAIVIQKEKLSKIKEQQLNALGIIDRRNSLFERLYKRCTERNWNWAIGNLNHQGRMHIAIMDFVNTHFYNNSLKLIDSIKRLESDAEYYHTYKEEQKALAQKRMLYYPSEIDNQSSTFKSNVHEAIMVANICKSILALMKDNMFNQPGTRIGVITPYRAQISAIKAELESIGITEDILVDTVERFQGSAKDIIILSLCLNLESQLIQLVNYSEDGIDRKLNVALTRAKEQLIIIGNESIMKTNAVYSSLINSSYRLQEI
jgi:DNA replication ATP-dependent helicase Dna2